MCCRELQTSWPSSCTLYAAEQSCIHQLNKMANPQSKVKCAPCAQLDNVTHETTTTSAQRPPTFTVHDYNITISAFQVTHKDTGRSLKMAYEMNAETCRSLSNK
jgi:hypothetical protein